MEFGKSQPSQLTQNSPGGRKDDGYSIVSTEQWRSSSWWGTCIACVRSEFSPWQSTKIKQIKSGAVLQSETSLSGHRWLHRLSILTPLPWWRQAVSRAWPGCLPTDGYFHSGRTQSKKILTSDSFCDLKLVPYWTWRLLGNVISGWGPWCADGFTLGAPGGQQVPEKRLFSEIPEGWNSFFQASQGHCHLNQSGYEFLPKTLPRTGPFRPRKRVWAGPWTSTETPATPPFPLLSPMLYILLPCWICSWMEQGVINCESLAKRGYCITFGKSCLCWVGLSSDVALLSHTYMLL